MHDSAGTKVFDTAADVRDACAGRRAAGNTLVTTNGCFDILHAGHVRYLREAALLGDMLVVGVNCEDVVRKLKGPGRPVQGEADRCEILAALEMVDAVFVFCEEDPRAFLEVLRPEVHVKGADYDPQRIIEKDIVERHGGAVKTVPFLEGRSTTGILARTAGK